MSDDMEEDYDYIADAAENMMYWMKLLPEESQGKLYQAFYSAAIGSTVAVVGPVLAAGKHTLMYLKIISKDGENFAVKPTLH